MRRRDTEVRRRRQGVTQGEGRARRTGGAEEQDGRLLFTVYHSGGETDNRNYAGRHDKMEARVHLPPSENIWRGAESDGVLKKPAGGVSASLSGWAGDGGPTPRPRFSAVRFCGTGRDASRVAGAAARQFRISDLRRSVHSFTDAGPDGADAPFASKGGRALKTDEAAETFNGMGIGPLRPGVFPLPAGRRKSPGGAAVSRPPPVRGQSAPRPDRSGSASVPPPRTGRRTGKSPGAASDPERGGDGTLRSFRCLFLPPDLTDGCGMVQ